MAKIDDLLNDQDFLELARKDESAANQIIDELRQKDFGAIPKTDNLLQRAMLVGKETARVGESVAAGYGIPQSMKFLSKNPLAGPLQYGSKMITDPKSAAEDVSYSIGKPLLGEPETKIGKIASAVAPFIPGGVGLAKAGIRGVTKGNIPQEIERSKGMIYDLIKGGRGEIKAKVGQLFDDFQKEFGARLSKIKGGITNNQFADALETTAKDIGAFHIEGSPGNAAYKMANEFRKMSTKNSNRLFNPEEIQAQSKVILDSFGKNTMARAKFYNNFLDTLKHVPELKSLKSDYAPIFEIAKQAKKITPGVIRDAATNKIGPETLADVTQAEQMISGSPGPIQKATQLGDFLRSKQNELQKIVGRQNALKTTAKVSGAATAGLAGLDWLKRAIGQ